MSYANLTSPVATFNLSLKISEAGSVASIACQKLLALRILLLLRLLAQK